MAALPGSSLPWNVGPWSLCSWEGPGALRLGPSMSGALPGVAGAFQSPPRPASFAPSTCVPEYSIQGSPSVLGAKVARSCSCIALRNVFIYVRGKVKETPSIAGSLSKWLPQLGWTTLFSRVGARLRALGHCQGAALDVEQPGLEPALKCDGGTPASGLTHRVTMPTPVTWVGNEGLLGLVQL